MKKKTRSRPPTETHSREFVRRIIKAAAKEHPDRYGLAEAKLHSKTIHITIEAAEDEEFYLIGDDDGLFVRSRKGNNRVDIIVRVSPESLEKILIGFETPVESFFQGHLRAKGETRDLYALHAFFLHLAEIVAVSPQIQDIVESFQTTKKKS